jgi:hypothetical protein
MRSAFATAASFDCAAHTNALLRSGCWVVFMGRDAAHGEKNRLVGHLAHLEPFGPVIEITV